MNRSRRIAGTAVLGLFCVAAAWAVWQWRESVAFFETASLLGRFPVEDATVARIDFALLRGAGVLGESKAPLEPEYREFLDGTGFNYRKDLDLLVASVSTSGTFFIAKGRFDWDKLQSYAVRHGGSCFEHLCRAQGSRPERKISFLQLRRDAIALAVSSDDLAATRLSQSGPRVTASVPESPAWLSLPGTWLRRGGVVPPGLKLSLSGLVNADRLVVRVLSAGGSGMQVQLDATCRNDQDASVLASQLRVAASSLASSDEELAKTLATGKFESSGVTVKGLWPLGPDVIQKLTAGI